MLRDEQIKSVQTQGAEKVFKLQTTKFATSNMHLFDSEGRIKKYDSPQDILKEFFHLRIQYYGKRKVSITHCMAMRCLLTTRLT